MDTEPKAPAAPESAREPAQASKSQPQAAAPDEVKASLTDLTAAPVEALPAVSVEIEIDTGTDAATETASAVDRTEDVPPVERTELAPPVEQTEDVPPIEAGSAAEDPQPAAAPAPVANGPALSANGDPVAPPAPPAKPALLATPDLSAKPEPPARSAKPAPRKRRWLRVVAVFLGLLVAVAVALVLLAPGYIRTRIHDDALERGIVLSFGDLDYDLDFRKIGLHDVKVRLAGVRGFDVAATLIVVDIQDWQPGAIRADGLVLAMSGTDVIDALGSWRAAHPTALTAPLKGDSAHVEWRVTSGAEPAITLDGARVSIEPAKGSIDASSARLGGRDAGPVSVAWTTPPDGFTVDIHPTAPPLSAIHAEVRSSKEGARIKLVLDRTPLAPLQAALGLPKGAAGMIAEGELEMPLLSVDRPAPVDGSLRMTVKGFVVPHPRDLDGILFGDTTVVRAKLQLAADLGSARLAPLSVETGALALSGTGDVVREGFDARVAMKLKGSIPCTMLATSAAIARLGSGFGGLAGGLLAGALKGNVAVSLSLEARASDIKSAKIVQSASINCKVSVPGLPTIVFR